MDMNCAGDEVDPSEFDIRLLDKNDCVSWQPPSVTHIDHKASASSSAAAELTASYEEARQQGFEEGRAQGEAEFRQRNSELKALLSSLSQPLADIDDSVESELSELAVMIGQQLCRRQLDVTPEQILDIVREGISRLPLGNNPVRIVVHPEDAAVIANSSDMEPTWQLVEEPTMERGGCEILIDSSRIDASMETRMAELLEQLFGDNYTSPQDQREGL
ncbi:MAG: flagellar assembly protein FliH [Bermanella sp.]|jgi:flagellar assembly protein FliH